MKGKSKPSRFQIRPGFHQTETKKKTKIYFDNKINEFIQSWWRSKKKRPKAINIGRYYLAPKVRRMSVTCGLVWVDWMLFACWTNGAWENNNLPCAWWMHKCAHTHTPSNTINRLLFRCENMSRYRYIHIYYI